jgi:hypothetical protein
VTQNWFDWLDELVASKSGVQTTEDTSTHRPLVFNTFDNLGEVTQTQHYDGDGVTITVSAGQPQAPSSSLLRAQENFLYDEQQRLYQTQVFDVNPTAVRATGQGFTYNVGRALSALAPYTIGVLAKQPGVGIGWARCLSWPCRTPAVGGWRSERS